MNLNHLFKNLQSMQDKAKKIQDELASQEVEASAGGDMVIVKMNGQKELLSVKIDPEVVNNEDVSMLEDLIVAATNEAQRRVQEMVEEKMGKLTAGLNIPGMPNIPGLFQ